MSGSEFLNRNTLPAIRVDCHNISVKNTFEVNKKNHPVRGRFYWVEATLLLKGTHQLSHGQGMALDGFEDFGFGGARFER